MNRPLKILFVSSEVHPFSKTGGLADVSGSLTKTLASLGCDVRVVTPFYKCVKDSGSKIKTVKKAVRHKFTGKIYPFGISSSKCGEADVYFINKNKYYGRSGVYGFNGNDYADNDMRFSFLSKAALVTARAMDFKPDVIHCNDWQTALIPLYLRTEFSGDEWFAGVKTLFTIHNLAYQGVFASSAAPRVSVPAEYFKTDGLEFYGKLNFMKSGILYSDAINAVSRRYAEEIKTYEFGCGLEDFLQKRQDRLCGIANGVDYDEWNPFKDRYIKVNYGPDSLDKKLDCKKDLLRTMGFDFSSRRPLIGFVGRLVHQKGIDMLANIIDYVVRLDTSVIILGEGDGKYNRLIENMALKHPASIRFYKGYNNELAHKIEAGSDLFLMPSRYEPCGLNQMYSIKYGTIPIVRATGGLDDVIVDFDADPAKGNGFKFGPAVDLALLESIRRAVEAFRNPEKWRKLMLQAMSCDFSWERSAREYIKLYEKMTGSW